MILGFSYSSQLINIYNIQFLPVHKIELLDNYDFIKNIPNDVQKIYILLSIIYKEHSSVLYI